MSNDPCEHKLSQTSYEDPVMDQPLSVGPPRPNRRRFVQGAAVTVATAASARRVWGANERVAVGLGDPVEVLGRVLGEAVADGEQSDRLPRRLVLCGRGERQQRETEE